MIKDYNELVEFRARTLCKSGVYETGQGTCAAICMEHLGSARDAPCRHATRIHGKAARATILAEWQAGVAYVPMEATAMMATHGHAAGVRVDMIWESLTHEEALVLATRYLPSALTAAIAATPYKPEEPTDG